ncbi:MAG TPA: cobalt-precorrin-5B (C(1))-methyltransferase CbiD, partial [Candidatus Methylomirabilis sp.]|nr:cobalt-precorrin-5B (C(1))-methyltransferase CbiD [Candidatus Methylomirabilis sp.]
MSGRHLRHGYTTGACAAAAAKGAALILRDQKMVDEVEINLPAGWPAVFRLHGQRLVGNTASCYVIKDAGDDPDVTNGAEIHVSIAVEFFTSHRIVLQGGDGVGRVTKPGLAVPVGEWAINPVPRQMILEGVKEVLAVRCIPATFTVTVSIPNGEELAKKTLNERLGIVGGLSILGTTGIVKPVSTKAWTDTIDAAIDVALACGSRTVVLSTGRTS